MDFLSSYTCRALRLKEDKWSRMMVSDEQRTYLSTFMDNSWPQARFFSYTESFIETWYFEEKKISKVSTNEQWCNSFKFCSFNLEIKITKVIQVEIIQTWVFDFYSLLLTWLALVWNFVYNALHEVNNHLFLGPWDIWLLMPCPSMGPKWFWTVQIILVGSSTNHLYGPNSFWSGPNHKN